MTYECTIDYCQALGKPERWKPCLLLRGQLQSTVSAKWRLPPQQRKARAHWNNLEQLPRLYQDIICRQYHSSIRSIIYQCAFIIFQHYYCNCTEAIHVTPIFCSNSSDQLEETLGIFRAFQALHVRTLDQHLNARLQGFIWSWKFC